LVGTTTGISAADRATTCRALATPSAQAADFARPGHIFPLRYTEGGVLKRMGHTEASVGAYLYVRHLPWTKWVRHANSIMSLRPAL